MDGIPALTLWDLVIEVFHSLPNQTNKTKDVREPQGNLSARTPHNMRNQIPTKTFNLDLANFDHVPSSVKHSGSNAMLHVFRDNEAVIKMIMKGRSPTKRHVSRTHRVVISHVTNGTIFFNCSTSAITVPLAALRIPACLTAPKRWRRGCKNRRKKK